MHQIVLAEMKKCLFLQPQRELSSVGSEHLPYKQRVAGSNPTVPTKKRKESPLWLLFLFHVKRDVEGVPYWFKLWRA